ncbi:MAG TPA: helix-turn-helix transcriptional regulator [Spirochaetales bacterium]|nr:helix-turn-helix transcriptional regulator [Spirochaetales bacterium]HPG86328.1 helix-turn-helix transcriptional regulator [Spirochaetales bacterium]
MDEMSWKAVHECSLEAGCAPTREGLISVFMAGAERLAPCDAGVGVFDRELRCVACVGWDERTRRDYNQYYRGVVPFIGYDAIRYARRGQDVVRWVDYGETEFMRDFGRALDLAYGLSPFRPTLPLNLSVQRSRRGPAFSADDCEALDALNAQMNNLLAVAERLGRAEYAPWTAERVRDALPDLSRREAEVLALCAEPLSMAQVASALAIGRRTAETHLAHVFEKLGVRSRREALDALWLRVPR